VVWSSVHGSASSTESIIATIYLAASSTVVETPY
jgi:hypothetical protein